MLFTLLKLNSAFLLSGVMANISTRHRTFS